MKDFLKRIRATAVELIEVASGLSKEQVSELINSEFEMEPLFADEINAARRICLWADAGQMPSAVPEANYLEPV